mgnify:CR=1 FL=1
MAANSIQPEPGERTVTVRHEQRPRVGVWQRSGPARRIVARVALVLVPVVMLIAIGLGVLYVRLSNGPVSLSYLKPAIERQISQKFGGRVVDVNDVVLSLAEDGGAFRLSDIKVRDRANVVVAQAPLASMQIDRMALLRGRVIPTGIVLIRPRMRLSYSDAGGLSLSFSRSHAAGRNADVTGERRAIAPTTPGAASRSSALPADRSADITVLRTIAGLLSQMRSGQAAGLSLDKIGVRNALIELDYDGRQSRWGIPSGDISVKHLDERSVVSGLATIAEAEGRNMVFALHAESSTATRDILLRTSMRGVQPAMIGRMAPAFASLSRLSAPVSAEARFKLRETGDVVSGAVTMEIGSGSAAIADQLEPIRLDHGRLALEFGGQATSIAIAPSTVSWGGGNELMLAGTIDRSETTGQWQFALDARRGHFVDQPGGSVRQPIERWSVAGAVDPGSGHLRLDKAVIAVAGGSLVVQGQVEGGAASRYNLKGRIGPAPLSALAYRWPSGVAPVAHAWVRENVVGGRVDGGRFALGAGNAAPSQSLVLHARDVQLRPRIGKGPVYANKVLVQVIGNQLQVSAPAATKRLSKSRAVNLKHVRFDVTDMWADRGVGKLQFGTSGRLRDGLALLSSSASSMNIPTDVLSIAKDKKASGTFSGQLNVRIPLSVEIAQVPVVTGQVSIKDLRAKDVLGRHDLSGGAITLDLAAKSVNASGEMLIAGVATQLAWQFILDAPLESQPPLRLQTRLDEADRDKLGIKVNHILRGIVDVDVNLIPRTGGGVGSKVRADLRNAAIAIDSLAWVKPTGRQTLLEFDVVPGTNHPLVLENLRVVGDGVAIRGRAMLDAKFNLRAFELPLFSIDRVTRLKLNGRLNDKNVWKVVAQGQTFEGRSLFRSLFDAGRAAGAVKSPSAQQMGIDLQAEVNTVLGFWNSKLSNVRMTLSKRQGKMRTMQLEGRLADNKLLKAGVVRGARGRRELHAFSDDAGKAFRLVGFYPNVRSGRLELVVNLDGEGNADKAGVLLVRKFKILGDQVVGELARAPRSGIRRRRAVRSANNYALAFDWMRVPFFVGNGQFILQGAELRGPVVGATIEGKADFGAQRVDLSGTYVPLQGLNGALGVIPGLGQILAGPNGEGVLGMKFAVRGPMRKPEMLVNPLSIIAPGIFREIFQISNPSLEVTKRAQPVPVRPAQGGAPARKTRRSGAWRHGVFGDDR